MQTSPSLAGTELCLLCLHFPLMLQPRNLNREPTWPQQAALESDGWDLGPSRRQGAHRLAGRHCNEDAYKDDAGWIKQVGVSSASGQTAMA
eukprot:3285432-Rhodomonas_salina.1